MMKTSSSLPQFGPFEVEKDLKNTPQSWVFRALDPQTEQTLLIKTLPNQKGQDPLLKERLRHEAALLEKLSHPQIATLKKWDNNYLCPYLAIEYVEGQSLRQLLLQEPLPRDAAFNLIFQICDGMQYLHEQAIIHKDLKPENIIVDLEGRLKIIDFSLACEAEQAKPHQLPLFEGTPIYSAPEVLKGEKPLLSSDLYAIGLISYELLTGRLSHGLLQIASLPPILQPILAKALHSDPQKRTASPKAFKEELQHYLKSTPQPRIHPLKPTYSLWRSLFWPTIPIPNAYKVAQACHGNTVPTFMFHSFQEGLNSYYLLMQSHEEGGVSFAQLNYLQGLLNGLVNLQSSPSTWLEQLQLSVRRGPFAPASFLLLKNSKNTDLWEYCCLGQVSLWKTQSAQASLLYKELSLLGGANPSLELRPLTLMPGEKLIALTALSADVSENLAALLKQRNSWPIGMQADRLARNLADPDFDFCPAPLSPVELIPQSASVACLIFQRSS